MSINLNLQSFLMGLQSARNSDTVVMKDGKKDGGETSIRGRFRSLFTRTERYRETTRQFVDKYCAAHGVSRDFATAYFEENLREHGAKPLHVRKVKSFLSAVNAKETEKTARTERFRSVMVGNAANMTKFTKITEAFQNATFLSQDRNGDADFMDVIESLKLCFLEVPESQIPYTSLFQFATSILNDPTLSTEQCTRRLNLLSAFVDPSNPQASFTLDYNDPMVRSIVQQLLERTDTLGANRNQSSVQILKTAFVHDASMAQQIAFLENSLSTPADFAALVQQKADGLRNYASMAVLEKLSALIPTPRDMTVQQKQDTLKEFLADPGVKAQLDMFFMFQLETSSYRVRNTASAVEFASPHVAFALATTRRDFLNDLLPGLQGLELDTNAARRAHPEAFQCTYRTNNTFLPTDFCDPRILLGMKDRDIDNVESFRWAARYQFCADYTRTHPVMGLDLLQPRADVEKQTASYAIFNSVTQQSGILTPYREISDKVKDSLTQNGVSLGDATKSMVETASTEAKTELSSERSRTSTGELATTPSGEERYYTQFEMRGLFFQDRVEELAGDNKLQAAVALFCLNQNQDELRQAFEQFGGKLYDKGVILEPDGNLRIVLASRKDSPVHFCKSILINPRGEAKIVADELCLTTRAEDKPPQLETYQDMFENVRRERDNLEQIIDRSELEHGRTRSSSWVSEHVCNSMLNRAAAEPL